MMGAAVVSAGLLSAAGAVVLLEARYGRLEI